MQAITFDGSKPTLRQHCPDPWPADGEALLQLRLAGICKTDLEILKGYMGFTGVMGHEAVATVLDGPDELIGRRVAVEINNPCNTCPTCRAGRPRHCPHRSVLGILNHDGCFAERFTAPGGNLHPIPETLTDEQAVFTEPLSAALRIIEQLDPPAETRTVVLGDGRLGLLCAMALATRCDRVTLVGRHETKLARARSASIETALAETFTPDRSADLVVEATGSPDGLALALRTVRPTGTIALKSTVASDAGMNLAPVVIDEVRVVGSRCGPFPPALAAMAEGAIDPTGLIDETFELADGLAALNRAAQPGVAKVLLKNKA